MKWTLKIAFNNFQEFTFIDQINVRSGRGIDQIQFIGPGYDSGLIPSNANGGAFKSGKFTGCVFTSFIGTYWSRIDALKFRLNCPYSDSEIKSLPYGHYNKPYWWTGQPWRHYGWFNDQGLYQEYGRINRIGISMSTYNDQRVFRSIQFRWI